MPVDPRIPTSKATDIPSEYAEVAGHLTRKVYMPEKQATDDFDHARPSDCRCGPESLGRDA